MSVTIKLIFLSFIMLVLGGCGGGGGSSAGTVTVPTGASATKVSVAFSTSGAATGIYGVQCKFNLPAGVTLATDTNGEVNASVISLAGGATGKTIISNYAKTAAPESV